MRDVFLLGAGFSKAISPEMPTLHELSEAVSLPRARGSAPSETNETDFESALTFLAQEQPWLTPPENLTNRAHFLEASRDIARHLAEMQARALAAPAPPWLFKLVRQWMDTDSTVVTPNYDVLIERAFKELVGGEESHGSLYSVPITHALTRVATVFGGKVIGPFKLLKLHGSLSWYYSGRESYFGEPIFDAEVPAGWNTDTDSVEAAKMAVSDKTPLVIPPTFGKSSFFQNETILRVWQNAWRAITDADRVFCIGYSLPRSDLNMIHVLRGASFRPGKVVVVNQDPDALIRYRDLLPGVDVEAFGDGPEVVENFVSNLVA